MNKLRFGIVLVIGAFLSACQPVSILSKPEAEINGLYTADLPSASSPGRTFFLTLDERKSAFFSTDFKNDEPAVIQTGKWSQDGDTLSISFMTLNRDPVNENLTFKIKGNTLTLQGSDNYGSEGLILEKTSDELDLVSGGWMWIETLDSSGKTFKPENPYSYNFQFSEDGRIGAQLDCNRGMGSYTIEGKRIDITMGATTLMACPQPSLAQDFSRHLDSAVLYFFEKGQLFFYLFTEGGTMRFAKMN